MFQHRGQCAGLSKRKQHQMPKKPMPQGRSRHKLEISETNLNDKQGRVGKSLLAELPKTSSGLTRVGTERTNIK